MTRKGKRPARRQRGARTGDRQIVAALREAKEYAENLIRTANVLVVQLDAEGRVTLLNEAGEKITGYRQAELLGKDWFEVVVPRERYPQVWQEFSRYSEGRGEAGGFENPILTRSGEERIISWKNSLLFRDGRVAGTLSFGMDVTERKRAEEGLRQAHAQLEARVEQRTADLKQANEQLVTQAREKAAADERQRLARELHDAVTQMLFSASIIAGVLPRLWERDREEGERRLEELRQLTRGALAEMRLLLLELRPAALAEAGLVDLLGHLAEATAGRGGLPVTFEAEGQCTLPPDVQTALYRVTQEALANAVNHSGASEVKVRLSCGRRSAVLIIGDNGCGFDPGQVSPDHFGLRIMEERAEAVGAALTVISARRRGTEVRAVWSESVRRERA